jgi:predicted aldo/keto reductase-like oxidoreductase
LVNPPDQIQSLWDTAANKREAVHWALQWLWNKPEVSLALSGMSTMEQVKQNIGLASVSGAKTNVLTKKELTLIDKVRAKYDELCPIPCTQCRYCMPCPNGVDIPRNFSVFNTGVMYNKVDDARRGYLRIPEEARAIACIQCRQCEELCPQDIPISEWMPLVHEVLGEGRAFEECMLPG